MSAQCKGKCKGTERAAWESPAAFGTLGDGTRILFCRCCMLGLREATAIENIAAPPNIAPGIVKDGRRMVDDTCGYDVVVLPELRPS